MVDPNSLVKVKPYPGLRSFKPEEGDLFFGREEQVDQLLEKLQNSHFVAVVGPSGCGKSSLVRAGLIPALKTGFLVEAGARWRIVEMRPSNQPLHNLAEAVQESFQQDVPIELLKAELRRSPKALAEVVKYGNLRRHENVLVIVDQFEELFRFRQNNNIDEVTGFINLLMASAKQVDVPIHVVITMRSDYLGECSLFHDLPEMLNDNQFLTPRLTRKQCKRAITGPAAVCGGHVEPDLVNILLNDLGVDHDQLPLLQHALMLMWNRDTEMREKNSEHEMKLEVDDYEAIGKLSDALSIHANQVFDALNDREKHIAEVMFKRLTDRNAEKKPIRRPTTVQEIADVAAVTVEEVIAVANFFRAEDYNFLMPDEVELSAESVLDISHESLMRQWDKLKAWMNDEEDSARKYRWLSDAVKFNSGYLRGIDLKNAMDWQEKQQPNYVWAKRYTDNLENVVTYIKDSRVKYRNSKIRGIGSIALLIISISLFAFSEFKNNEKALQIAKSKNETDSIIAEKDRKSLDFQLRTNKELQKANYVIRNQKELAVTQRKQADFERKRAVAAAMRIERENSRRIEQAERSKRIKSETELVFEKTSFYDCRLISDSIKDIGRQLLYDTYVKGGHQAGKLIDLFDTLHRAVDTALVDPTEGLRIVKEVRGSFTNKLVEAIGLKIVNEYAFSTSNILPDYGTYHTTSFISSPEKEKFFYNVEGTLVEGDINENDSLIIVSRTNYKKSLHILSLAYRKPGEIVGIDSKNLLLWKNNIKYQLDSLPGDENTRYLFSPNGRFLLKKLESSGAILYSIGDFDEINSRNRTSVLSTTNTKLPNGQFYKFSPDSKYIAICIGSICNIYKLDGTLSASYNIANDDNSANSSSARISAINFSQDSKKVIIGTYEENGEKIKVLIWNLNKNHLFSKDFSNELSYISYVTLSPDESKFIAGSTYGDYDIVYSDSTSVNKKVPKDSNIVYRHFIDNNTVITANYFGEIKLWKLFPEYSDLKDAISSIKIPVTLMDKLQVFHKKYGQDSLAYHKLVSSNNEDDLLMSGKYYYAYGSGNKNYLIKAKQFYLKLRDVGKEENKAKYLRQLIAINNELNEIDKKDYFGNVYRIKENIDFREIILSKDSLNDVLIHSQSKDYGNLAWYQLFVKDFKSAIASATEGLRTDKTNDWIYTNLAPAYLLNHQFLEAELIYVKYKDKKYSDNAKEFKVVFLNDLDVLEDEGIITSSDKELYKKVTEIRTFLKSVSLE